MHELSVTESVLRIALKHAQSPKYCRVTDVYLVIGRLSTIVDDSVQFYWNFVAEGTAAEGSKLHFRRIPAEMFCQECELCYVPAEGELVCPKCGGYQVRVVSGDQFYVEAIEVEHEQENLLSGTSGVDIDA
jgi:hydrogenase nickel incorporation protein HypA/HybF